MSKQTIAIFCVLLVLLTVVAPVHAQKLKPEELVAKHLDSIGPADKRQAVTKRMTVGTAQVSFRVGGSGTLNGAGNILSDGNLLRLGFAFKALDYSGEQVAFDGKKVTAGQISPGVYPPFSRFIYENDLLIKEGLLFGSLSTGWALLDVAGRKPKMESNGLKKIDGRQLHEMKYLARTSKGGLQAFFYFDPETFRHVRSVFKMELPATQMSRITDSAELVRYQILEQYDNFKEVEGLTLPHSYKVDFTIDAPRGGMLTSWTHIIDRIAQNQPIEQGVFSLQ